MKKLLFLTLLAEAFAILYCATVIAATFKKDSR